MKREEIEEFHYIALITNLASIMAVGILAHNQMKRRGIPHESVAMPEIQERRELVTVPGGRPLHDYVNLYFHARNPMMYVRRDLHASLCVLRVSVNVLDLPAVVVTDCNASSDYVRFAPAPAGLAIVDGTLTFAEYWTHDNPIEAYHRKSARCAEVLVPDRIHPNLVLAVYVSGDTGQAAVAQTLAVSNKEIAIIPDGHLFFR